MHGKRKMAVLRQGRAQELEHIASTAIVPAMHVSAHMRCCSKPTSRRPQSAQSLPQPHSAASWS